MKRRIFIILTIFWMVIIFIFSARNADISTEDSHRVGMLVGQMVISDFEDWTAEEQEAFAASIDHPIRKTAHASEYCVLAILACCATAGDWSLRKRGLIAWMIATGYACTDEFHQLFVPGRSCQITDVGIDSIGAVVGVVLWLVVAKVRSRQRTEFP